MSKKNPQFQNFGTCCCPGQRASLRSAARTLLRATALQSAIINRANFSSITTDAKGVIQLFNVGAECMLGYKASDVIDKVNPGLRRCKRLAQTSIELHVVLRNARIGCVNNKGSAVLHSACLCWNLRSKMGNLLNLVSKSGGLGAGYAGSRPRNTTRLVEKVTLGEKYYRQNKSTF
jgi:hypothetical protein